MWYCTKSLLCKELPPALKAGGIWAFLWPCVGDENPASQGGCKDGKRMPSAQHGDLLTVFSLEPVANSNFFRFSISYNFLVLPF